MDPLPDRDWVRNGDPEYEAHVRRVLTSLRPVESREDSAACFKRLIVEPQLEQLLPTSAMAGAEPAMLQVAE